MSGNQNRWKSIVAVFIVLLGAMLACARYTANRDDDAKADGSKFKYINEFQIPSSCFPPPEEYHWEFRNRSEETGSRGSKCTAELVFENKSDKTLKWFYLHELSDGISHSENWVNISLKPSETVTKRISHSIYYEGRDTYIWITRFQVFFENPECAPWISDINRDLEANKYLSKPLNNPCP